MKRTLGELAKLVGGQVHGDDQLEISGAETIRNARPGDITLATEIRLQEELAASDAAAVVVPRGWVPDGLPALAVDEVLEAFVQIVLQFRPPIQSALRGVSAAAHVSSSATLGENVVVHAGATIGEHARIGSNTVIHSGVHILSGCQIGDNCRLFPNVVLYENTVLGARTTVHAGAVLGAYGFGFATENGRHKLTHQLGYVEVGDDVEIGACTTIDRGTFGATRIGDGTKIDNQVMIGHNCRIGRHNMLCSQVGIAGSCSTGDYVVMGGQVGISDHVAIGDQVRLAAKAGVKDDLAAHQSYFGSPALPQREALQVQVSIKRLPEIRREVRELKRQLQQLSPLLAQAESGQDAA